MKIGVISLGCAKNLIDTENLLGLLSAHSVELVNNVKEAEAVIINTCGFIEPAKEEAINTILKTAELKNAGLKKLIVMGCLVERYKEDLVKEIPEVDRFIAIKEYGKMGNILSEELGVRIPNSYGKEPRLLSGKPWMSYLKIADGCDNKCSYCAIPLIRGPLKSRDEDEIIEEAKQLVKKGVKEINLVAQDSSRYGYDLDGKLHLSSLLRELDNIEGIKWIRILYLYPDEIPDDLIETIKETKHVLPYFDIPIQHASNRILKLMNRRGTKELIKNRCALIRKELPEAILRTTLITGFPSETEEDHQEVLELMKDISFDHLGVFAYSKEEDTASYDMEDDVSSEDKNRRLKEIQDLQVEISAERLLSRIGLKEEAIIEKVDPLTNMFMARSSLYAPDEIDGFVLCGYKEGVKLGDIVRVKYKKVSGHNMIADIVG